MDPDPAHVVLLKKSHRYVLVGPSERDSTGCLPGVRSIESTAKILWRAQLRYCGLITNHRSSIRCAFVL
jgi:hypothetical protein